MRPSGEKGAGSWTYCHPDPDVDEGVYAFTLQGSAHLGMLTRGGAEVKVLAGMAPDEFAVRLMDDSWLWWALADYLERAYMPLKFFTGTGSVPCP